jgi:hypothetical protein
MVITPRAIAIAVTVTVSATAPTTAAAQDAKTAKKAKRLFTQGNKAFDDGRYADALAAYRASYELVERPSTLFNIAVCRDRIGELEDAYVDYEKFLEIATKSKADTDRADKAKERIAELDTSLAIAVIVTSSPVGAAVYFEDDHNILGRTPVQLNLPIGVTGFRLEAPGHIPKSAELNVRPGIQPTLDLVLAPLAKLTVTAAPSNATIEVEGNIPRSAAGRLDIELEPGTYLITVKADGYTLQTVEIAVVSGTPASKHVALEKVVADEPPVQDKPPLPPPARGGGNGKTLKYTGLGVGVAGIAALAFGIERGITASARSDDAQAAAVGGEFDSALYDSAQSAETTMIIMYAVGAAGLISGGVLYWMGVKADARTERLAVTPVVTPTSAIVGLSGSF